MGRGVGSGTCRSSFHRVQVANILSGSLLSPDQSCLFLTTACPSHLPELPRAIIDLALGGILSCSYTVCHPVSLWERNSLPMGIPPLLSGTLFLASQMIEIDCDAFPFELLATAGSQSLEGEEGSHRCWERSRKLCLGRKWKLPEGIPCQSLADSLQLQVPNPYPTLPNPAAYLLGPTTGGFFHQVLPLVQSCGSFQKGGAKVDKEKD